MRKIGPLYMGLSALLLALPIAVVCGAALNGVRIMFFSLREPTLARFGESFISEPVWTQALGSSVLLALGAVSLAVLLAWPLANLLWSTELTMSGTLAALRSMPFAVPPMVFGVRLAFVRSCDGGLGAFWAGVVSHAVLPMVFILIGLQSIDRAHLDPAVTMGATEEVSFPSVVLQQTVPYTISVCFFVLAPSCNESMVMFFASASSPGYATVTLQIINSLRNSFTPKKAVAVITFIGVSVFVFSAVVRWGDLPRPMGADQSGN